MMVVPSSCCCCWFNGWSSGHYKLPETPGPRLYSMQKQKKEKQAKMQNNDKDFKPKKARFICFIDSLPFLVFHFNSSATVQFDPLRCCCCTSSTFAHFKWNDHFLVGDGVLSGRSVNCQTTQAGRRFCTASHFMLMIRMRARFICLCRTLNYQRLFVRRVDQIMPYHVCIYHRVEWWNSFQKVRFNLCSTHERTNV